MEVNRREFVGHMSKLGAALMFFSVGGSSLLLSGCNVISDIESWVPVGLNAVDAIDAELAAAGITIPPVVAAVEADVRAALNAVAAAAAEYGSTTPAPVGALQKLQAALHAVTDQFAKFLSSLNIPGGGLLNLILALAGIVLSTIAGFMNKLPNAPAGFVMSEAVRINGQAVMVVPKQRSKRAFKKDWNSQLDAAKRSGVPVAANAYLHLSLFEHL